jgi:hypothetical protein
VLPQQRWLLPVPAQAAPASFPAHALVVETQLPVVRSHTLLESSQSPSFLHGVQVLLMHTVFVQSVLLRQLPAAQLPCRQRWFAPYVVAQRASSVTSTQALQVPLLQSPF